MMKGDWNFFSFSFDGCSNYCVGQARAVVRPAVVVPEQRINPAQVISALPFRDITLHPPGQTATARPRGGGRCEGEVRGQDRAGRGDRV